MKMWLAPYQLVMKASGQKRQGYLLKLQTADFETGYADVFPWTEFGDPAWEDIPKLLAKKEIQSDLLKRSLILAKKDGVAREQRQSLFQEWSLKNHYLLTETNLETALKNIGVAIEQGFSTVKMKVGRSPKKELAVIQKLHEHQNGQIKWRFDFNTKASEGFIRELEVYRESIEFIEDPFLSAQKWSLFDMPWAFDQPGFDKSQVPYLWRVIKPAKQSVDKSEQRPIVFTSYMDHPVGIAHAFSEAQSYGEQKTAYGLMSQQVYEETSFHQGLNCQGENMSLVSEAGIGFTELLKQQDWKLL